MDKNQKYIIIALVGVIIALVAGIGCMLLMNVEYQTINLSAGTTMDVPKTDDAAWTVNEYGIRMYTAPSKKTAVTSFNSQENPNLVGAAAFAMVRDSLLNGSASVEKYNGIDIRENTVNGTHYYMAYISNNATHDNIFMASDDLGILKHMIDSISFGAPGAAVVNATTTESAPAPVSSNDTDKMYSEDDMMGAAMFGYYTGYYDGYSDSSYNDYDYSDSSSSYDESDYDYYDYDDYDDYDYDDLDIETISG